MIISIDTKEVEMLDPNIGLVNVDEFKKASAFIMKCLSDDDAKTLREVYNFNILPLVVEESRHEIY